MKPANILSPQLPALAAGFLLTLFGPAWSAEPEQQKPALEAAPAKAEISATGTVFSVEPEIFSVVMKDNPTPVRFSYDKSTPFLDETGEAVPLELVRVELPLTVYYLMEGEKMVARRVVVSRSMVAGDANAQPEKKRQQLAAEKAQETLQLSENEQYMPQEVRGNVATIEQTISIVARGGKTPSSCIINNSTRFVNSAGQPVSGQLIKGGMPITIKSIRDGRRVIAQEIIIHGNAEPMPGEGSGHTAGGTNGNINGQSGLNGNLPSTTNRDGSGGINGFNDLQQVQGSVLPGQIPSQTSPRPGTPSNAGNPASPTTPPKPAATPAQPSTTQPKTAQPANPQPATKQPATPPAGGN